MDYSSAFIAEAVRDRRHQGPVGAFAPLQPADNEGQNGADREPYRPRGRSKA
jgi:hypothetical protein